MRRSEADFVSWPTNVTLCWRKLTQYNAYHHHDLRVPLTRGDINSLYRLMMDLILSRNSNSAVGIKVGTKIGLKDFIFVFFLFGSHSVRNESIVKYVPNFYMKKTQGTC